MMEHIGLHNRRFRSVLSLLIAAVLVSSISYLGVHTYKSSHADSAPSIYLNPNGVTVATGSTLSMTIRENSGTEAINSVQASLEYDSSELQFSSITEGGTFPIIAANSTGTPGVVRVGRATSDTPVTGDNPIVTVNFKVIGPATTGTVTVDKSYSLLVDSTTNNDVLQTVGTGSYTITGSSTTAGTGSSTSSGSTSSGATTTTNTSTPPILYISPASSSYATGANVSAVVRLNSYTAGVTAVETAIAYPANQLQYVSTTEGGVYTTQERTKVSGGVVDIIRGISGGSSGINGDNPVVTVNFKVIGSNGTAALTFAAATSAYDASGTGTNILNLSSSKGATYTIVTSGTATTTTGSSPTTSVAASSTVQSTSITTPSQAVTIGSKASTGSVALTTASDGSTAAEVSGSVELAPVSDQAFLNANPTVSVQKVQYYLNGKLISTQNSTPFTYKLNSSALRNGTYDLVVKTSYSNGSVDTRSDTIVVKNNVTLAYDIRHYGLRTLLLIIILAVLAALIWKLAIPHFARAHAETEAHDHDALYGFSAGAAVAGPIAGDPTVVAPTTGSTNDTTVVTPDMEPPISLATQTTAALPMSPLSTPTSAETTAPSVRPSTSDWKPRPPMTSRNAATSGVSAQSDRTLLAASPTDSAQITGIHAVAPSPDATGESAVNDETPVPPSIDGVQL